MSQSRSEAAEPSPGQFSQNRGRNRSWEKGIVWDPQRHSLEIKKLNDIGKMDSNHSFSGLSPLPIGHFDVKTISTIFTPS